MNAFVQSSSEKEELAPNLVLGLGNDLLGDDAIGLVIARALAAKLASEEGVEVTESGEAGFSLLERISGRRNVVIVDSIQTGKAPIGSVVVLGADHFRKVVGPSAHYAGLPEVLELGKRLELPLPDSLHVVAVETEHPLRFGEKMSPAVCDSVAEAMRLILALLTPSKAKVGAKA